jgi:hypothetical protein
VRRGILLGRWLRGVRAWWHGFLRRGEHERSVQLVHSVRRWLRAHSLWRVLGDLRHCLRSVRRGHFRRGRQLPVLALCQRLLGRGRLGLHALLLVPARH